MTVSKTNINGDMKSYLSLIPISARVRRRQNRMTILCIVFAVFLVTSIFTVADMAKCMEYNDMLDNHGNWHIRLEAVPQDTAEEINARPDVNAVGIAGVFNFNGENPYYVNDKKSILYGVDEIYMTRIFHGIAEGNFPGNDGEVLLSPNAAAAFGAQTGDTVTLHTPAGDRAFTVSGVGSDDNNYYKGQTYLVGVYMTRTAFASLMAQNEEADESALYIQFQDARKAAGAKAGLQAQYGLSEKHISENTGVMATAGQSSHAAMKGIYELAAILFVMVLLAGVLMISGSMNSNVAQRTQFFGLMRCIGASREQILRFVRLEALNWCKTAVPAGLVTGTVISWGICGVLHYGIGGEFAKMPVFQISPLALVCGTAVGIAAVLLAAQFPARRAAKTSPVSAVSGNAGNDDTVRRSAAPRLWKIEASLGMHHATESRRSWCLMTGSFALTVILFLSFCVFLDFAGLLLPAQSVTSADMSLSGYGNELILARSLPDEISKMDGVETVYGSCYMNGIPVSSSREGIDYVNMVSYDSALLDYAEKSVVEGSLEEVYQDNGKAATVYNKDNPLQVGDTIQIAGSEVEIVCALSQGLFGEERIVICPEEMMDRLMGVHDYGLIGIQLAEDAAEETVARIRSYENENVIVSDMRTQNKEGRLSYLAARVVCYGFVAILGIITLFHIMNSISMSVSARVKQYGVMRAVGMDDGQLHRMICAEAFVYAVSGLIAGIGIGIPVSRFLYVGLVTRHMGIAWQPPVGPVLVAAAFVFVSAAISVYAPSKRIRKLAVTETINEL